MTIGSTDLKLRTSEVMSDSTSVTLGVGNGGRMGTGVITGTPENDVFPDVTSSQRAAGVTQLRKVWLQAMSDENAMLAGSAVALTARPSDPNARVMLFRADGNDLSTVALARLRGQTLIATSEILGDITLNTATFELRPSVTVTVGEWVSFTVNSVGGAGVTPNYRQVIGVSGSTVTFNGANVVSSFGASVVTRAIRNDVGARPTSVALLTAAVSAGGASLAVDRAFESFDQPSSTFGIAGTHQVLLAGDTVAIINGATRELATVQSVNFPAVTLAAPLTNAFPAGSTVSALLPLGDLRATVSLPPFSQQTWLRSWSDTVTTPATATYSGSPTLINAGAITDRWSIVFRTATAFDLVSERYGQLVAGTTTTDFIPVNPATNQPYFTLLAAGWGGGWLPGNCLRFNTQAAAAPFWIARTILPGASSGSVNAQITMTGDVDA